MTHSVDGYFDIDVAEITRAAVKRRLHTATQAAIARGVFGVPTLDMRGELFRGAHAMPMASAYLDDPTLFDDAYFKRARRVSDAGARRAEIGATWSRC